MSDLVERLRIDVLWHKRRGDETTARDCQEAADEIERLAALAASNFSAAVDAQERVEAAVAAERERCARVCEGMLGEIAEEWETPDGNRARREANPADCAAAIRQPVDNQGKT